MTPKYLECILIVENLRLTGGIRQALKLIVEIKKKNLHNSSHKEE